MRLSLCSPIGEHFRRFFIKIIVSRSGAELVPYTISIHYGLLDLYLLEKHSTNCKLFNRLQIFHFKTSLDKLEQIFSFSFLLKHLYENHIQRSTTFLGAHSKQISSYKEALNNGFKGLFCRRIECEACYCRSSLLDFLNKKF